MEKFSKLSRDEMKKISGGTVHICIITCTIGTLAYQYSADKCPLPKDACPDGGDSGCVCT